MRSTISFLFLISLLFLGCGQRLAPGFIVLPNAEGMKTFYVRGIDKMIYRIKQEYPADKAIKEISEQLEKNGWKSLDKLFLYPDQPTSRVQGWTFYEQSKRNTGWMVYEWSTDWKDANDNIVSYILQFRDPIQKYRHNTYIMKPSSDALIVNAVYMPAKEAVDIRESLKPKEDKQ